MRAWGKKSHLEVLVFSVGARLRMRMFRCHLFLLEPDFSVLKALQWKEMVEKLTNLFAYQKMCKNNVKLM